jgi:NAD-dependent dihydropyrimidine dehydrogenase PreA subunit/flavodoxin
MKILLLYYTGTYNTKYLTNLLKNKFENNLNVVDIFEVKGESESIDLSSYDLIGLGYPIYAFNTPKIFYKYLKNLKLLANTHYFIYKQSGETIKLNNASSRKIKKLINKSKGILVNEQHYVMPYNIHFRYEDNCVKEILKYDEMLINIQLYEIRHNIHYVIKSNTIYNFISRVLSIYHFGAKINHSFYKIYMDKCNNCKKCLKECPTKNIYVNKKGQIDFGPNCEMCMRCSFICPNNAIKIGMLEGWKVNGPYNLNEIKNNPQISDSFITPNQKGFFKCYLKTYDYIQNKYNKYFL